MAVSLDDKFAASCSLRAMGNHLCVLPPATTAPKDSSASAVPTRSTTEQRRPHLPRMLASHERASSAPRQRANPPVRSPPDASRSNASMRHYDEQANSPATRPRPSRHPPKQADNRRFVATAGLPGRRKPRRARPSQPEMACDLNVDIDPAVEDMSLPRHPRHLRTPPGGRDSAAGCRAGEPLATNATTA